MRQQALMALGLSLAACSGGGEGSLPDPTTTTFSTPNTEAVPTSTTTTISQAEIDQCLARGAEEIGADGYIWPISSQECVDYARSLYDKLASTPLYRRYLTSTKPYFNFHPTEAGRFQEASGIALTQVFDAVTIQTMKAEVDRLSRPVKLCANEIDPTTWSRETLVDRLAAMGAFTIKYPFATASRTDLLNQSESSDKLVSELSVLTHWALCNDIRFNVLIVKKGHGQRTLSGGESQHFHGNGVDIRPFNGNRPMPAWAAQPEFPQLPKHWIANNPAAFEAGKQIMAFLASRAGEFNEVIWTGAPITISNGNAMPNFSRGPKIDDTHHDHIHLGVKE